MTSFSTSKKGTIPMPSSGGQGMPQHHQQQQIATIEAPPNTAPMQIPTVTCDLASDISTSETGDLDQRNTLMVSSLRSDQISIGRSSISLAYQMDTIDIDGKETLKVSTITTTGHGNLNVPMPPPLTKRSNSGNVEVSSNSNSNSNSNVKVSEGAGAGAGAGGGRWDE